MARLGSPSRDRHRVLIVGAGAREHALAWKLRQSPLVESLQVAPGNPGTAEEATNVPASDVDRAGILRLVQELDISLTVIGPESAIETGMTDALLAAGRLVVGPSLAAFRLESSKSFAKDVMIHAGVPTAGYEVCHDQMRALKYLDQCEYPVVVKADGLAAGKGVSICRDTGEARRAVRSMMQESSFGEAGRGIVIEDFLSGEEVSLIAFVDGKNVVPLPLARDHKRLRDGDRGPNTGGMGAFAPVPGLDRDRVDSLVDLTLRPVVGGHGNALPRNPLRRTHADRRRPRVLEYNCRFGDPETQAILPVLGDDLLPWLVATAESDLMGHVCTTDDFAVGVVFASAGYPERPCAGAPISGLDDLPEGVIAFHAGTALDSRGRLIASGGRVLTIVGIGEDLSQARERAYSSGVCFDGMQVRSDIAGSDVLSHPHRPTGHIEVSRSSVGATGRVYSRTGLPRLARVVVLASGEGSNLQALIDACASGALAAEVVGVISHPTDSGALERAKSPHIPGFAVPLTDRHDVAAREALEENVARLLNRLEPDVVVLAGWMLVLSERFLGHCSFPIVNVHPSLLPIDGEPLDIPILKGGNAVANALRLQLPYTGVSVHHVTAEVDSGPVIVREAVRIEPGDNRETLHRRLKRVEHRLVVSAVRSVIGDTAPTRAGAEVAVSA